MTFSAALDADFKGVISKLVSAAKAFKSDVLKAAEKAPVIASAVEKDAPEVLALIELAFPGAGPIEAAAINAIEVIATAIEGAGTAAGLNGLSVTFDKELIASIEAVIPALKAFAAKL